jgi:hypothetical protein
MPSICCTEVLQHAINMLPEVLQHGHQYAALEVLQHGHQYAALRCCNMAINMLH